MSKAFLSAVMEVKKTGDANESLGSCSLRGPSVLGTSMIGRLDVMGTKSEHPAWTPAIASPCIRSSWSGSGAAYAPGAAPTGLPVSPRNSALKSACAT